MDPLIQYVVDEQNRRFAELKGEIAALVEKVDDLRAFKIQMLSSAKGVSLLVSSIFGLAGVLLSAAVSYLNH